MSRQGISAKFGGKLYSCDSFLVEPKGLDHGRFLDCLKKMSIAAFFFLDIDVH